MNAIINSVRFVRTALAVGICLSACLFAQSANAETVTLKLDTNYATNNLSGTISNLWFTDSKTNERVSLIYAPFTSSGAGMTILHNTWTGNKSSLSESPYTDLQKAQLQSLFDHVYYYAYDNGTGTKDDYVAGMLSNVIYGILRSSDAYGNIQWKQSGSSYSFATATGWVTDATTVNLLNSWAKASVTGDWSAVGYEEHATEVSFYDLTSNSVFLVGATKTPFFSVAYASTGGSGDPDPADPGANVVPEPATLAVLGLGLAGLGLVRRRR